MVAKVTRHPFTTVQKSIDIRVFCMLKCCEHFTKKKYINKCYFIQFLDIFDIRHQVLQIFLKQSILNVFLCHFLNVLLIFCTIKIPFDDCIY